MKEFQNVSTKKITLTNSTVIDSIDNAIKSLRDNPKLRNSTIAKNEIDRLEQTKRNLIMCVQKRYKVSQDQSKEQELFGDTDARSNKINYQTNLLGLMSNNYKALSIDKINDLQNRFFVAGQQEKLDISNFTQDPNSKFIDFVTGKKMLTLSSIVKMTISAAALTLLSFGVVNLFALNPIVALVAGAIGLAGLARFAKKAFAPEIKKYLESREIKKTLAGVESDVNLNEFNIDEEKKKNDNDNKDKKNVEALQDLHKNFSSLVNSVEDLKKLKKQLGNTVIQVTDPKSTTTTPVNFEDVIKANAEQIENLFRDAAKEFEFDTDNTRINKLREQYKDFLSEKEINKITDDLGFSRGENFSQSFSDIKNSNMNENDDFKNFKASCNTVITELVDEKTDLSVKRKSIKKLELQSKTMVNQVTNETDKKKLETLCNNMIDMMKELFRQIENGKGKGTPANADAAKKAMAEQHGLDEQEFKDFLNE